MKPIEIFWNVVESSEKKLNESFNFPDVIPYGSQLLKLISENEGMEIDFSNAFLECIDRSSIGHEPLVEFCMHSLKWAETKLALEELSRVAVENNNFTAIQRIHGVLAAFEDDWEDANDFYLEYFGEQNT